MVLLFAGLVLGALWWRCSASDGPAEPVSSARRGDIQPTSEPTIADRGHGPAPRVRETELPPSLPAKGAGKLVTIDRGPARPGEDPERYRDRVEFARSFDAFVREASLTDEQQRALLLAFYDFLEQRRHVFQIIAEERTRGEALPPGFLEDMYAPSLRELILAEQEILTREQREIYGRTCGYCAQGLALSQAAAGYDEPVLRVEGER